MKPSTSMWIVIAVIGLAVAGFMAYYFMQSDETKPATPAATK